jgi:hypothetical protein
MRALLLASILAMTAACNAGAQSGGDARGKSDEAGAQASRNYQVGGFDKLTLTGSPNVVVAVGGQPSVRAEGDAADLERLEIAVVDGELRIGMRPGSSSWFGSHHGITVHVTVPGLRAASIAGSGDINIDRVQGQTFAASVGGSGDLDVRQLRVGQASFALTGSGGITAAGAAQSATASLNGSGDLRLAGFETAAANVTVVGSGDVALRATGTAQIQLTGSGDVTIAGGARCTIARTGSGDVRCDATGG